MLPLVLGFICFAVLVPLTAIGDQVGLGLLLSSDVGRVADARREEPVFDIPPGYLLASAAAGLGAVLSFPEAPPAARWLFGVLLATFLLLTIWDMRRRRGALAIYILLRRAEIGFEPRGDVIEVPKLVFLVMNQPTPLVWLFTAISLGVAGAAMYPYESWTAMVPLVALAVAIFWLWVRNRQSPWEPLARRLRWVSFRSGSRLTERLESALELDPEVVILRMAAEAAVARFISRPR